VRFNAAAGIKPWKQRPRDRLVSDVERGAFRIFLDDETRTEGQRVCYAAIWLSYLATQRRIRCWAIRLEDITDEGIRFAAVKGCTEVQVPWTEQLREAVSCAKSVRKAALLSTYLLCNGRTSKPYSDSGIKAMWSRLQVAWQQGGHEPSTTMRAAGDKQAEGEGTAAPEISGHRYEPRSSDLSQDALADVTQAAST
jgi:hypothetical protein